MFLSSAVYIFARMLLEAFQSPRIFVDSQDYLFNASLPIGLDFFVCAKPVGTALLYKVLAGDLQLIVMAQSMLSACCWLFFALALYSSLRKEMVRWPTFILVLLFSMQTDLSGWNRVILSESLSLSLMVLTLGLFLFFIRSRRPAWGVALVGAGLLWALTKETNAWLILMAGMLILLVVVLIRSPQRWLMVGSLFLAIFLLATGFSNLGERWRFPLLNVIGQRILVDPDSLAFFEQHGMPVSPALMDMAGTWGDSKGHAFDNSPELRAFQTWYLHDGNMTYRLFLLSTPLRFFTQPLLHLEESFSSSSYGWLGTPWITIIIIVLLISLIGFTGFSLWKGKVKRPELFFFAFMVLLTVYPHLLLVWHGDAMELSRHALGVRAQLGLGMLLLLSVVIDDWMLPSVSPYVKNRIPLNSLGVIFSRILMAGGILAVVLALVFDWITSSGYAAMNYVIGIKQILLGLGGVVVFAFGYWLEACVTRHQKNENQIPEMIM